MSSAPTAPATTAASPEEVPLSAPEDREVLVPPSSVAGVLLAWLAMTAAIAATAAFAQDARDMGDAVLLSAVLAVPGAMVVRAGHLGRARWEVPTPGAFIFFFWLLSLTPSLISLSDEARAAYRFTEQAVTYGRAATFGWMFLFAVALGQAPRREPAEETEPANDIGVGFVVVMAVWLISAIAASRYGVLSFWRGATEAPETGSGAMSLVFLYIVLTPMVLPVALLTRMRTTGGLRVLATTFLAVGAGALFVVSSRRLWLVSLFLCLSVLQARRALGVRWLAATLVLGLVGAGPLLWAFRGAQRAGGTGGAVETAWHSVGAYATDDRTRREAATMSEANLRVRLGIAGLLFGVTQEVLERGPELAPSPLEPLVRSFPTLLWPGKNEVANGLSAQAQLHRMGRFPEVDLSVSPVTEFVLQVGPVFAPFGGLLYGLGARMTNSWRRRAATGIPRFVAWLGFFVALSYFDGGTLAMINVREPIAMALALGAITAIWRRTRAPA